jgi:type IV pilus assembly protein PilQ
MHYAFAHRIFRTLAAASCLATVAAAAQSNSDSELNQTTPRPTGAAVFQSRGIQNPLADPGKVAALLAVPLPGAEIADETYYPIDGSAGGLDYSARDRPVREVFSQLRLAMRRNIVVAPDVEAVKYTGDLYGVDAEEAIDLICLSTGLMVRDMGNYISIENAATETRYFMLKHVPAPDVETLIKTALSDKGKVTATKEAENGIETSASETGGDAYANDGMLIVHDYPRNLDKVAEILKMLDKAPQQVHVEVTVLNADVSDLNQLGVNFSALAGVDYREYGATSSDGFSINDNVFNSGQLNDGVGRFGTELASDLVGRGMQFGFIKDNISAFVRAIEEQTAIVVQANTSLITMNKQRGEVKLVRSDGYSTTTVSNGVAVENVKFLETGTKLILRPFIQDNGIIRMEIHPEDSDGGIAASGYPFEQTAEMTSNVMVRSGDTLVIGGLFREKRSGTESKVPLLGSLPLVGGLFRSSDENVRREEVIILLTPRIIDIAAQAAQDDQMDGRPNERRGSDRAVVAELYGHTARALVLEGKFGSAMVLLNAAGGELPDSSKSFDLAWRISKGLVSEFASTAVDARITDSLKRRSISGR